MQQRLQGNPKKRIALLTCTQREGLLVVRMVDILSPFTEQSQLRQFDTRASVIEMDACLNQTLSAFNDKALKTLLIHKTIKAKKSVTASNVTCLVQEITLTLPTNFVSFFGILGAMDGFVNLLVSDSIHAGYTTKALFMRDIPEYLDINAEEELNTWIPNDTPRAAPVAEQAVSRLMCDRLFILMETNSPHLQQGYANIKRTLHQLYNKTDGSIAYLIRLLLYPNNSAARFIKTLDKLRNTQKGLVVHLLDPEIDLTQKAVKTIEYMRSNLSKWEGAKRKQKFIIDFDKLFLELELQKFYLWFAMVNGIFGNPGLDKMLLGVKNTEVMLLREAKLVLNDQDLLVLCYKDTDPYKNYYAEGKDNYVKIEQELQLACSYMGIYFKPNQDFHSNGGVVLTHQSTLDLLSYGFHYSKAYVKDLLRVSHAVWGWKSSLNLLKETKRDLLPGIFSRLTKHHVLTADIFSLFHAAHALPELELKPEREPEIRKSGKHQFKML